MVDKSKGHIQGRQAQAVLALAMKNWRKAVQAARHTDLPELKRQRNRARRLKQQLDELLHVADERLTLPLAGNQTFPRPHDCDWHWRPELWCGALPVKGVASAADSSKMGHEVTLFHDCRLREITLRQLRNMREADLAAYGLRMEVFRFSGSYLSLALDLPKAITNGLKRNHVIQIDTILETEAPLNIFVRLNMQQGPNTEQKVLEFPKDHQERRVEFDLAYTDLNEKRIEKVWLDLIFENPQMNQMILRDLTILRRKRADM